MQRNDFIETINDDILEYFDESHIYLINGIIVPSITRILRARFVNKYTGVPGNTLKAAAEKGTAIHEAIEAFIKDGVIEDYEELRNYRFLADKYGFEAIGSEIPVILYNDGKPIAAGRLDLLLRQGDDYVIADIKRTYTLDIDYLGCQLNLYRIAYQQSYQRKINKLKALHLREKTRKYIDIPINEEIVNEMINEWRTANE